MRTFSHVSVDMYSVWQYCQRTIFNCMSLFMIFLALRLPLWSASSLCKQFELKVGPTKSRA